MGMEYRRRIRCLLMLDELLRLATGWIHVGCERAQYLRCLTESFLTPQVCESLVCGESFFPFSHLGSWFLSRCHRHGDMRCQVTSSRDLGLAERRTATDTSSETHDRGQCSEDAASNGVVARQTARPAGLAFTVCRTVTSDDGCETRSIRLAKCGVTASFGAARPDWDEV